MGTSLDKNKLLTAFEVSEVHMREVLKRGVTVAVVNFEQRAVAATQQAPKKQEPIKRSVIKFDPGAQAGKGILPFEEQAKPRPEVNCYIIKDGAPVLFAITMREI